LAGLSGRGRLDPENEQEIAMPYFLSLINGITADGRLNRERGRNMDIRIKSLVRGQMVYGFEGEKDGEGEIIGSSVVRLARRNAFELIGLKRPALAPAWRWKSG
jgi:hypothetical protein